MEHEAQPGSASRLGIFFLLLALALLVVMPSAQSLWMDESIIGLIARRPDFSTFWDLFWHYTRAEVPGAEALKPLYSWVCWLCALALGTGEWALRAPNILWMSAGVVGFWSLGRRWQLPWLPLALALFPFVWYYMDEARPYALQLAAGCWMVCAVTAGMERQWRGAGWLWSLMISSLVMSAASMLGVLVAAPCFGLVLASVWCDRVGWRREWALPLTVGLALHVLLGGYYLIAIRMLNGGEAAKLWNPGWSNVVFSLYEMTGFAGLGPGRTALRELAKTSDGTLTLSMLCHYAAGWLALALTYLGIGVAALRRWYERGDGWRIGWLFGVPAMALALMILVAFATKWPFWGRHLSPAVPFLIAGCIWLIGRRKMLLVCWLGVLAFSSLNLRFNSAHGKDDNRAAAELARAAVADGQTVWWVADVYSAMYYRLPVTNSAQSPGVWLGGVPAVAPARIILCKPDIYDADGHVRNFLREHRYQPTGTARAFVFWELPREEQP